MFKSILRFLGSKKLSISLLIIAAFYFSYLSLLWFLNTKPPAFFMVWFPVLVLFVIFLANVIISLFTRHYAYAGNIIFHAAFVVIAIGIVLSLLYRFEGQAVLTEGSVFWGEKSDYAAYDAAKGMPIIRVFKKRNKEDNFDRLAPKVSFKLDKIIPEYWGERLHFTRLDGEVRYPAETLENKGTIKLNGGLSMGGARIRHTGFGFAPEVTVFDTKSGALHRQIAVINIFPPGSEDYLEIKTGMGNYKMYVQVIADPANEKGRLYNKSMNLVDPIFKVRVTWLDQPVYYGILKKGENIRLGDTNISFAGVKYWLAIEVVKDPGEMIVIIGLISMGAGLLMRLFPMKL